MIEKIVLGGGCFWCLEAVFQRVHGVISVTSGYAGGHQLFPTYEDVCSEKTGHAEVVLIEFNPDLISLDELLYIFFTIHDPTTLNKQGYDIGSQYRSIIIPQTSSQREIVEKFILKLTVDKVFQHPIVTTLETGVFWKAEDAHQNYFNNFPENTYCKYVIHPKINFLESHMIKK